MRPAIRLLVAGFVTVASSAAFAGASQVPIDYVPDPALKTASLAELERRVARACATTQARLQSVAESTLTRPCGCYASRTMRALAEGELAHYRERGYFDDGARGKALAAIDACGLRRPL